MTVRMKLTGEIDQGLTEEKLARVIAKAIHGSEDKMLSSENRTAHAWEFYMHDAFMAMSRITKLTDDDLRRMGKLTGLQAWRRGSR